MWVDMLLIDVNSTVIRASINAHRLPKYHERLAAGKMYSLSGFDVSRAAQNYKLSDSALQIRFSDSNVFDEITEPVSPSPEEGFRFRNQSELVGLANTNSHLPGIVGEITSMKSTVGDDHGEKNRVMATIKLDSDLTVVLLIILCFFIAECCFVLIRRVRQFGALWVFQREWKVCYVAFWGYVTLATQEAEGHKIGENSLLINS